jgi:hypothetical protein
LPVLETSNRVARAAASPDVAPRRCMHHDRAEKATPTAPEMGEERSSLVFIALIRNYWARLHLVISIRVVRVNGWGAADEHPRASIRVIRG